MKRTTLICWMILATSTIPAAAQPTADALVRDLQSASARVRARACSQLGNLDGETAVSQLAAALDDPDATVRRAAAKSLGELKDHRPVPALIERLADEDFNVRTYAAYALGEIKDARSTEALLRALRDEQWTVRDQAAWALREVNPPQLETQLVQALKHADADVPHLLWLLRQTGSADVVKQLATLLATPDTTVRLRAVQGLRQLKQPEAFDMLLIASSDGNPDVRKAAIRALVSSGDPRVEEALRSLAEREQDPAVGTLLEAELLEFSPSRNLLGWWDFEESRGAVAKDVTENGNDGEILGCEAVAGRFGKALAFGPGKYIELGKPGGLPIQDLPFTVMAWCKSDTDNGVIVGRGGAFCGFSLYIKDGLPKFGIHRLQDGPTHIAAGREAVIDRWVHLAGVVHNDRIELYVDGKLAATAETPGYLPSNCGQGMEIGFDVANSAAEITDAFQGVIDEVKFYQAALDAEDMIDQSGIGVE